MNIILIMLCIIFVLCIFIVIAIKIIQSQRKENKTLSYDLDAQKKNTVYLYKHAEEVATIERDKSKVEKEILEAKSEEDVLDIINSVIAFNNARLCNNKKN